MMDWPLVTWLTDWSTIGLNFGADLFQIDLFDMSEFVERREDAITDGGHQHSDAIAILGFPKINYVGLVFVEIG